MRSVRGRLELEPILRVVDPTALQIQPFSRLNPWKVPNHSNEIVLAWNSQATDSVTGLVATVDEPLYLSAQLLRWGVGRSTLCGSLVRNGFLV